MVKLAYFHIFQSLVCFSTLCVPKAFEDTVEFWNEEVQVSTIRFEGIGRDDRVQLRLDKYLNLLV